MEETTTPVSVRSVGLKFGMISTVISIVFFLALALSGLNAFDNKWNWVGLIISVVILIIAQKSYKDGGDGFMSYGQGFGIGFWIAIVAVIGTGLFTFLYVTFIDPTVMDLFYDKQMEAMQERGMPDNQIEVATTWTKKLFWPLYAFFGIIFSLLVPLIVTIFTQKKNPQGEMI